MNQIEEFLQYLDRQRRLTKQTRYNYELFLTRTQEGLHRPLLHAARGSEIERAIWDASHKRKTTWNGGLSDDGTGWRSRCATKVSKFFCWAYRERLVQHNPYPENTFHSAYRPRAEALSAEQINVLYNTDRISVRDHMMLRFFMDTGFRISEAVNVEIDLINWNDSVVKAWSVKERRFKTQPLTQSALNWIKLVIGKNRALGHESKFLFFDPETGNKSSDKSLRLRFRKISEIIGFRVHPHLMRHTIGTVITEHVGIAQASEFLGHTTLDMTKHYHHNTTRELGSHQRAAYEKVAEKKKVFLGA